MNERIKDLALQAGYETDMFGIGHWNRPEFKKFAELLVAEFVGILELEIKLEKEYKSIACNDSDVRWHQGKIDHFTKLVSKTKAHFEVGEGIGNKSESDELYRWKEAMRNAMALLDQHEPRPEAAFTELLRALNPDLDRRS